MNRSIRLALLVLAGLLTGAPAGARTLTQLIGDARVFALDTGASRNRFTDAQITEFLNRGQEIAVLDAKPISKAFEFDLVAGTTYYDMPSSNFLQIERVTRDHLWLDEMTLKGLDRLANQWQTTGGLPNYYFISWSTRNSVGFYPFPDSASSTATIRIEYYAIADDLSSGSDQPFGGLVALESHERLLAYFAAYQMTAIDGRLDLATFYRQEFKEGVARLKREARARPNYHPRARGSSGTSLRRPR